MTALELKNSLLKLVAETDDLDILTRVQAYFQSLKKKTDWWEELSKEQRKIIETGRQQLTNGEGISHEKVQETIKERINKF